MCMKFDLQLFFTKYDYNLVMASNAFHGRLNEFPAIGVDRFNIGCEVYLLTHAHKDHLVGLDRVSFNSRVYCSETTKRLVTAELQYRHKAHMLRPVECNKVHEIEVDDNLVSLVLVPTYHCPGSVLFLVYDSRKAVLVTGDVKAESWWIDLSVRNNPNLYGFIAGNRTLDCIYFDSSFGHRGEPYIEMPHNDVGIRGAIALLQQYPKDDPEIYFTLRDTILGFEECWAKLSQALGAKIELSQKLESRLKRSESASDAIYSSWVRSVLNSNDCGNYWTLKVGPNNSEQNSIAKFSVKLQQCIDFNLPDLLAHFWPINYNAVEDDSGLQLIDTTCKGHQIYEFRGRKWLKPQGKAVLLPSDIRIVFSRHSSYSESKDLISCFKPKQVYPCLFLKSTWKCGFSMKRLFLKYCSGTEFAFDEEMRSLYGSHNIERGVVTINRWDFKDCQSELEFLLELKQSGTFKPYDFIGQKPYTNKRRRYSSFLAPRTINLEVLISGRNEERYRKWIEEQQAIYRGIETNERGMNRMLNYENQSQNSHSNPLTNFSQHAVTLLEIESSETYSNRDTAKPTTAVAKSESSNSVYSNVEESLEVAELITRTLTESRSFPGDKMQHISKRPRLIRRNSACQRRPTNDNLRSSFSSLESSFIHTKRCGAFTALDKNVMEQSFNSLTEDRKKWFTMSLDSVLFSQCLHSNNSM